MDCSDYARVFNMLSYNCNIIIVANVIYQKTVRRYPDNCPLEENCPRLGFSQNLKGIRTMPPPPPPPRKIDPRLRLGFGSRSGLVLGLGGNQKIAPEKSCPPVRVRVWLRVSFAVGGQLSQNHVRILVCSIYTSSRSATILSF